MSSQALKPKGKSVVSVVATNTATSALIGMMADVLAVETKLSRQRVNSLLVRVALCLLTTVHR
jgi:hypothetical protein